MDNGFNVKISESSREFNARERVAMKDYTDAIKLDSVIKDDNDRITLTPADWAVLAVHNPKAERPDYNIYILVDKDGNKYYTSSLAFWASFMDIYTEMDGEQFSINVFKCESKNYKGKYFITCSIVW